MLDQIYNLSFWEIERWGNTLGDYAVAFGALVVFLIVFKLVQVIIIAQLRNLSKKTKTDIDDTLIDIVASFKPPFYTFLALYFSLFFIEVTDFIQRIADAVLTVWIVVQAMVALQILVDYVVRKKFSHKDDGDDETNASALRIVANLLKGVLWAIAILLILSNLGVNITSLVAGLGIGGLAIAFALQNVLADLFASFSIYFDKPFKVGDFIVVGDDKGRVEKIGIKTTRIRALGGEELVMSNQELTSARVQNFRKLEERRISFAVGVTYETHADKLKTIPKTIQRIIEEEPNTRFDRVHFASLGDFSLNFEAVYYVLSSDYNDYMNAQQSINLKLIESFAEQGIDFAYPVVDVRLGQEVAISKKGK